MEFFLYIIVYLLIGVIYRYTLSTQQQAIFKNIIKYFEGHHEEIPLTFILGLYVALIVKRWWDQYNALPWPDELALQLRGVLVGRGEKKERGRLVRRTIVRYCLLSYILALRCWSPRLHERFSTIADIMKAGLLREDEFERLREKDICEMYTSRWWVPIQWSMEILVNANYNGLVLNAPAYASLISQVRMFKQGLQNVKKYVDLPVPLVYSQVVTLAVYIYFGLSLIADQYIIGEPIDLVFPFLLTFKFFFFFGLLSVAESLHNPWFINDEDFYVNKLLSRHLKVTFAIVDQEEEPPVIRKDIFWDDKNPRMLHHFNKYHDDNLNDTETGIISNIEQIDAGKNAHALIR